MQANDQRVRILEVTVGATSTPLRWTHSPETMELTWAEEARWEKGREK